MFEFATYRDGCLIYLLDKPEWRKLTSLKYQKPEIELGIKLNMRVIADALEDIYGTLSVTSSEDYSSLLGVRFYRRNGILKQKYVYFVKADEIDSEFETIKHISFIVSGKPEPNILDESCRVIQLPSECNLYDAFDVVQQLFEHYSAWDVELQNAINNDASLDEILKISIRFFHNPIFVHDTDFYIMSCPLWVERMTAWEIDVRTGREMVPFYVINDFKVNPEYLSTLQTIGAQMFSAELRGYQILYVNLWCDSRYEGRICILEIQSDIRLGQYMAAEYLARVISFYITKKNLFRISLGNDYGQFFVDVLSRNVDADQILERICFLGWNQNDNYFFSKLGMEQRDFDMMSQVGAFNYIESKISASHAFHFDKSIVVLVNLTVAKTDRTEVLSNLAYLVREGLFKLGASSVFNDFTEAADYYLQACIALEYGRKSGSMIWCYLFEDYVMPYIFDVVGEKLEPSILCSRQLQELMRYDKENNTMLYETLDVYLKNERNAVRTAKELFIHRSTLFYRLDRIKKLVNLDLDDPNIRLYLEISYQMLQK